MALDNQVLVIFFGAVMVGLYSWSRFDEPSYDSQTEFFCRYKPRFSTSYARYARAKLAYVCAIIAIYLLFSLVPQLYEPFSDPAMKPIKGSIPLGIALAIITLQNTVMLKDLERISLSSMRIFTR